MLIASSHGCYCHRYVEKFGSGWPLSGQLIVKQSGGLYQASVLSHVKCRRQALKFDACIIGSELPIYRGFHLIAARLPRGYFRRHLFPAVDTPSQALSDHHVDFDFGDVEPTAMIGRKDELEAIP